MYFYKIHATQTILLELLELTENQVRNQALHSGKMSVITSEIKINRRLKNNKV